MLVCGYKYTADLRSLALRLRVATHSCKIQVVGSVWRAKYWYVHRQFGDNCVLYPK